MVTYDNFELLKEHFVPAGGSIILLGEQEMNTPEVRGGNAAEYLSAYFEHHVNDLDINGEAWLTVDLSKYSPEALESVFRVETIADFGTTEHTSDPANAIRNVCEWLGLDGVAIFVNPSPDYIDEENHSGLIRFTTEFWEAFTDKFNFERLLLDTELAYPQAYTAVETRCVFRKTPESIMPKKREITTLLNKYCK